MHTLHYITYIALITYIHTYIHTYLHTYIHTYIRERQIGEREAWGDAEDGEQRAGERTTEHTRETREEGEKGEDNVGGLSQRL